MRRSFALALALLAACRTAGAQSTVDGDLWVTGTAGVGTASPSARLEVQASSATATPFQVSAVDDSPLLHVDRTGRAGLGTEPAANLDIWGVADLSDLGLQLRSGNLYPGTSSYQLLFGYNNQAIHRHAIRTRHADSIANNSMDFLLWHPGAGVPSAQPTLEALSLVTTSTQAAAHVRPYGTPDVELEVSNGAVTGGGTVHRALEAAHSSVELKTDLRRLGRVEARQAFEEAGGLRHVSFRYKGALGTADRQPRRRGLLFEEAPESVRGGGKTLVFDERLANAELALQELARGLEEARLEAAEIGAGEGRDER